VLFHHLASRSRIVRSAALLFGTLSVAIAVPAQKADQRGRDEAVGLLQLVKTTIQANYYDPKFQRADFNGIFDTAEHDIQAGSGFPMGVLIIGRAVEKLLDSHTVFFPPPRPVALFPGWRYQMAGDKCFVVAVEPDSEAWKTGLRPGDEVLRIQNVVPQRSDFESIRYLFGILAPPDEFKLTIASPEQQPRDVVVKSRSESLKFSDDDNGFNRHRLDRFVEGAGDLGKPRTGDLNTDVMVWKLPAFNLNEEAIAQTLEKARKHKTLILDLRQNGGGFEKTLDWMIGNFFSADVTVGDTIQRTGPAPLKVTSRGDKAFNGQLIVRVDSASGSASEIFARTVQLQKRGVVLGDRTAGAVGRAQFFPGRYDRYRYALEITVARIRFSDGTDLDGTGVNPDTKIIPTGADLAAGRDPVLSAAARLAGVELSPEDAGRLFPAVWATY
jgi:C-terminal processing protease CtpA/Prc